MKIDHINSLIVSKREPASMSDPPLPGEELPALAHALNVMEAYVSEQFDALVAKTEAPSSRVAQLLQTGGVGVENRRRDAVKRLSQLTSREADVLNGLADGKSNKNIAVDLKISPKTVEVHRSRIMKKLQCDSLFELGRIWEAALSESCSRMPVSYYWQKMIW